MEDHRKSLVGGIPTPLKNDGVKVSWDHYSIPNFLWKVIQNSMVPVTTNQNPILDSESMSHFKIFSNWELYPDFLPSDVLSQRGVCAGNSMPRRGNGSQHQGCNQGYGGCLMTYSTKMPQSYRKNMEKS